MEQIEEKNKAPRYKTVKIRVSQNEYTLIKEIAGETNVSTQIRDMFLDEQEFAFKNMPKINNHLLREVAMIVNNVNQLARAVNENKGRAREEESLYSMELLATIEKQVQEILDCNVMKVKGQREFKKLISSNETIREFSPINENRKREIKICFNQEQYEQLISKSEELGGKPVARVMREYFISQAERVKKAIPPAKYEMVSELNTAGTALNYIAKGVNERRKAGVSLVLHSVMAQLEMVQGLIEKIHNKETTNDF
ncbi:plasmid mobilization relaxosome protein MobC [Billgrantia endophytica]|uniref:Bacterial mobilisation domain-containing protein n=1 Tax=Billgrantia endophytica TaxID=2033802 RepID=A0A2N7TUC9_9GAMM|nr:plasmid mobilization relaxosome protein MobC [Halomonas endophytica]PMR71799.1 hypothetical protein C1H69_22970 [Halomonas endophytica]